MLAVASDYTEPMTQTMHAHVSTESRDCDGGHGHDYTEQMNDDERADDWPEYAFTQRLISGKISFMPEQGQRLTISEDGFEWYTNTDEGYSAGQATWCTDDCDLDGHGRVYDQYAEMMGY